MQTAVRWTLFFLIASVGTLIVGMITKWVDRKVTARVQWRVGPPWYQPFADVLKLLGKETILPEGAGWGFLIAPLVGFAATCVAAAMIWAANVRPEWGFVGDVVVVLYLLTIPSLMIIIGGSLSGNPYGAVGASREGGRLTSETATSKAPPRGRPGATIETPKPRPRPRRLAPTPPDGP